ncbi:thioesterase family protein [Nocardioides ferulae]|uniref:thioesterase family protein n=1 Tax=Nocardioides ferulae TaxID=2340821 RepID=UPI000EB0954D|nr:acyl-CoA thioesterase [Nocardioides ferulae]
MRHLYECPLRWADMDLLGHVNNVVYVDYLQEARVDMLRTHRRSDATAGLAEGLVVARHEVTYLSPLTFRFRPVRIECWVTEIRAASFTMAYEVFDEIEDPNPGQGSMRRVYLRASTVLTPYVFAAERPRRLDAGERRSLEAYLEPSERTPRRPFDTPRREPVNHYPVRVRFSDVDVYGHVNNVKYFEYLQEARIQLTAHLWSDVPPGSPPVAMVVAQTDVDYLAPLMFRAEPYDSWSWISHVGRSSATIESEIRDGDTVYARARVVVVFFDQDTQRAAPPAEVYREPLLAALTGG